MREAKWTTFIEYLELNQKLYCLEYDDHRIANLTKEQYESFNRLQAEQPPASDFTKECRELRLKGATSKQWKYAEKMMQACDRLDASEDGERILEERIEKLSDTLDASEASRKELAEALEKLLLYSDCSPHCADRKEAEKLAKATIEKQS